MGGVSLSRTMAEECTLVFGRAKLSQRRNQTHRLRWALLSSCLLESLTLCAFTMNISFFILLLYPLVGAQAAIQADDLDLSDFVHDVQQKHRKLDHTLPPIVTPQGCEYMGHDATSTTTWVDEIACPNFCSGNRDFALVVTTMFACDEGCPFTTFDCLVQDCCVQVGQCPCATLDLAQVCDATVAARCQEQECHKTMWLFGCK